MELTSSRPPRVEISGFKAVLSGKHQNNAEK
jgi:hypothetical protein